MGWFAQNARPHPRRSSLRQLQHVAEADEIIAFPGFAPYKTRQSINQTQQQQAPARQAAHALLGNDGGGRLIHRQSNAKEKKKQTKVMLCPKLLRQTPS